MSVLPALTKAAGSLLVRSVPRRSHIDLRNAVTLAQSRLQSEDDRTEFCNTLLSQIDTQMSTVPSPVEAGRRFVACEFNRDGDAYRCPLSNKYVLRSGEEAVEGEETRYYPPDDLRDMESIANHVFASYARLYYGKECVSSAFLWDTTDPVSSARRVGMAVVFVHRKQEKQQEDDIPGVWNSTHVVSFEMPRTPSTVFYNLHSTVYLDAVAVEEEAGTKTRFNGFVSRADKQFKSSSLGLGSSHIAIIGEKIQEIENALRDAMAEIYFGKAAEIISKLRVDAQNERKAALLLKPQIEEENKKGEAVEATPNVVVAAAASPAAESDTSSQQPKKSKKKKPALPAPWEAAKDEEGNTYYYNSETGETSWELPGEVGAASPTDGGSESVESILSSLRLKEPVEEYVEAFKRTPTEEILTAGQKESRKKGVRTAGELCAFVLHKDGAAQLETVIMPVFGDRRKLLKWAAKYKQAE